MRELVQESWMMGWMSHQLRVVRMLVLAYGKVVAIAQWGSRSPLWISLKGYNRTFVAFWCPNTVKHHPRIFNVAGFFILALSVQQKLCLIAINIGIDDSQRDRVMIASENGKIVQALQAIHSPGHLLQFARSNHRNIVFLD